MDHNDPGEQSSWGSDKPFSGGNGCQTKGGGEQVTPCEVSLTLWILSLVLCIGAVLRVTWVLDGDSEDLALRPALSFSYSKDWSAQWLYPLGHLTNSPSSFETRSHNGGLTGL